MEVSKERMVELVKNAPDGATHFSVIRGLYSAGIGSFDSPVSVYIGDDWMPVCWMESSSNYIKLDYSVLNGMGEGKPSVSIEFDAALNDAGWKLSDELMKRGAVSADQFNHLKQILKSVIESYLADKGV